jgi:hypothetical protein
MVNKNGDQIGCKSGRVKIVDPNNFNGFNSSDNMSVPTEDLNISVILKTFKKARTVLTTKGNDNLVSSSKEISINFIQGSDVGGEKSLTTKFTDLTTIFDKDTFNDETLGITNIDIDFNASMAPMVNIDFIDVRGSSIFQNEYELASNKNKNKYSTFFQMPYPLFELTVKGYYGKPVTYCLHMVKFTSKFNSKTGNFEIQCQFIGYTYAMLSDMLIGYLKSIYFTEIGAQKYAEYNSGKESEVPYISMFLRKMEEINEGAAKISSESEPAKASQTIKNANDKLGSFIDTFNELGRSLDNNKELIEDYEFIIIDNDLTPKTRITEKTNEYKTTIDKQVTEFNSINSTVTLDSKKYQDIITKDFHSGFYSDITNKMLTDADEKFGLSSDLVADFRKKLIERVKPYNFAEDKKFSVYYNKFLFEDIERAKTELASAEKTVNEALAYELKKDIKESLDFEPTVRNFIEIFTAAIEVFMESIHYVSISAEKKSNTDRLNELKSVFNKELNSDIPNKLLGEGEYFAWPDYREFDAKTNTYVEKYLGTKGVLNDPNKVDEVKFIEELLLAFIESKTYEDNSEEAILADQSTWVPVNVLDTVVFGNTQYPYKRTSLTDKDEVLTLAIIRAMTLLGYTNAPDTFTGDEIVKLAKIEADSVIKDINPSILKALCNIDVDTIVKVKGKVNNDFYRVIGESNDEYYYDFIRASNQNVTSKVNILKPSISNVIANSSQQPINNTTGVLGSTQQPQQTFQQQIALQPVTFKSTDLTNNPDSFKILPVSDSFGGDWQLGFGDKKNKTKTKANSGTLFLTNYSSNLYTNSSENKRLNKFDDGGVYLKIFKKDEFTETRNLLLPSDVEAKTESEFAIDKVNKTISGYNFLGGSLGIQEYTTMKYSDKKMPLMYAFYDDYPTGLAYNRKKTGEKLGTSKNVATFSPYSITNGNKIKVPESSEDAYKASSVPLVFANLGKNNDLFYLLSNNDDTITYPYIEITHTPRNYALTTWVDNDSENYRNANDGGSFSLFGSTLYYYQNGSKFSTYAKAFLFLHTLPFNVFKGDPFGSDEILSLFNKKGGFIQAPRLWCAYVGSILWRVSTEKPILDSDGKIIGGGSGANDPINWTLALSGAQWDAPKRNQFFTFLGKGNILYDYFEMEDSPTILKLPTQVKEEFKKIFFDFVNGDYDGYVNWEDLRGDLEIFIGSGDQFDEFLIKVKKSIKEDENDEPYFNKSMLLDNNLFQNRSGNKAAYSVITPINSFSIKEAKHFFLQLSENTVVMENLLKSLTEPVIIANTGYKIWGDIDITMDSFSNTNEYKLYSKISVKKETLNNYFKAFIERIKEKGDAYSPTGEKNEKLQELFGTTNQDTIKLSLYKTCKNIHDKWLAGISEGGDLIFQCGTAKRNNVDVGLSKKYRNNKPRLIDSFRFVSRSFKDIGDTLFIDPTPIYNQLHTDVNTGAYDVITSLLSENNFTFEALPSFINFRDDKNVEALFTPYGNYGESIKDGQCGPSFVCVYVGQTSKNLDISSTEYSNDGFDFRCQSDNQGKQTTTISSGIPDDFTENLKKINNDGTIGNNDIEDVDGKGGDVYEDPVAVFTVKYSQQNQNIFKDITLDQSEFSETDESIKITEAISKNGVETSGTLGGQNLYNVYSVRSYSAEVDMMGNAMIQPMMYFQLDNIPMFHGAYMITRVKHSIKPNNMSTNFKGVRIRYAETPLVSAYDFYMSLASRLNTSGAQAGDVSKIVKGSFPPIVRTLIDNGVRNGAFKDIGKIKFKKPTRVAGIKYDPMEKEILIEEACEPLTKMLTDWVSWMKSEGFEPVGKDYGGVTSMGRSIEKQKALANSGGAPPGTSNHGWGIAVDIRMKKVKSKTFGDYNFNNPASKSDFKWGKNNNYAYEWLMKNSYKYGFINPIALRSGSGDEEFWHFEYHGTSAKCLYEASPTTYGQTFKDFTNMLPVVKNPKTPDGKVAVYVGCDYNYVNINDGSDAEVELGSAADYWTLVAISSIEAITKQGSVDVAQSIYNRLLSKQYKADSIKELIVSENGGQYEPVGKAVNEFKKIKDKNTAIAAIMKAKSYNKIQATKTIEDTVIALNDKKLRASSASAIGARTDFYAKAISAQIPKNAINKIERDKQIFGYFFPGSIKYGSGNPSTAKLPDFSSFK